MDDWDQGAADIIILQREPVAIGSISEDAGWNLVAVQIEEVAKPASLKRTIATLTRYRTLGELPEDTVWFSPSEWKTEADQGPHHP